MIKQVHRADVAAYLRRHLGMRHPSHAEMAAAVVCTVKAIGAHMQRMRDVGELEIRGRTILSVAERIGGTGAFPLSAETQELREQLKSVAAQNADLLARNERLADVATELRAELNAIKARKGAA